MLIHNKRLATVLASAVTGCLVLSACAVTKPDTGVSDEVSSDIQVESADTVNTVTGEPGSSSENGALDTNTDTSLPEEETVELSSDEITKIEDNLNSVRYNGFITAEFASPEEIWWDEIFYNGAQLPDTDITHDEVEEAYRVATDMTEDEELFADITYVKKSDAEAFAEETTHTAYSEMEHPLDWLYLDGLGIYVNEHGDTNFRKITCLSGTKCGDTYTVRYCFEGLDEDPPEFEVIFDNPGSGYVFKSNLWSPEGGREAGVKALYDPIILKYALAVSRYWNEDQFTRNNLSVRCPMMYNMRGFAEDPMECLGYCLYDVDEDGTDELFIGAIGDDYKGIVYDAFDVKDGTWGRICRAFEDSVYYLAKDGTFYEVDSLEQQIYFRHSYLYGPYRFLYTIDCVNFNTSSDRETESKYTYSDDDFWKNIKEIDGSEYDAYRSKAEADYMDIPYIPFSQVDISTAAETLSGKSGPFTEDELCEMSLDYYEAETGYRPMIAEVDGSVGDIVTLHLYDDMGDHIATSAWFEIDRNTGEGSDMVFDTYIDLKFY